MSIDFDTCPECSMEVGEIGISKSRLSHTTLNINPLKVFRGQIPGPTISAGKIWNPNEYTELCVNPACKEWQDNVGRLIKGVNRDLQNTAESGDWTHIDTRHIEFLSQLSEGAHELVKEQEVEWPNAESMVQWEETVAQINEFEENFEEAKEYTKNLVELRGTQISGYGVYFKTGISYENLSELKNCVEPEVIVEQATAEEHEHDEQTEQIERLQDQIEGIHEEKQELIEEREAEIEELETKEQPRVEELKTERDAQIEELNDEVGELKSEVSELKEEQQSQDEERQEKTQQQIDTRRDHINTRREQITKVREQTREQITEIREQTREQIADQKTQIEEIRTEKETEIVDLREQIAAIEAEIKDERTAETAQSRDREEAVAEQESDQTPGEAEAERDPIEVRPSGGENDPPNAETQEQADQDRERASAVANGGTGSSDHEQTDESEAQTTDSSPDQAAEIEPAILVNGQPGWIMNPEIRSGPDPETFREFMGEEPPDDLPPPRPHPKNIESEEEQSADTEATQEHESGVDQIETEQDTTAEQTTDGFTARFRGWITDQLSTAQDESETTTTTETDDPTATGSSDQSESIDTSSTRKQIHPEPDHSSVPDQATTHDTEQEDSHDVDLDTTDSDRDLGMGL